MGKVSLVHAETYFPDITSVEYNCRTQRRNLSMHFELLWMTHRFASLLNSQNRSCYPAIYFGNIISFCMV